MTPNDIHRSLMSAIQKSSTPSPSQYHDYTFHSLPLVAAKVERTRLSLFLFFLVLWKHIETPIKFLPAVQGPAPPSQIARYSVASSLSFLCLKSPVIDPPWLFLKWITGSLSAPLDWFVVICFVFLDIVIHPSRLFFWNPAPATQAGTASCPESSEVISSDTNPHVARMSGFSPFVATMMLLFSLIPPTRSTSLPSASSSSGEGERLDLGMHTSTTVWISVGCVLILAVLVCLCLVARKRNYPSRSPPSHSPTHHRLNPQLPRTLQNDDEHEVYPGPPAYTPAYTRTDTQTLRNFPPVLVITSTMPGARHPVRQDLTSIPPPVYIPAGHTAAS